jgi:hypothetical protein
VVGGGSVVVVVVVVVGWVGGTVLGTVLRGAIGGAVGGAVGVGATAWAVGARGTLIVVVVVVVVVLVVVEVVELVVDVVRTTCSPRTSMPGVPGLSSPSGPRAAYAPPVPRSTTSSAVEPHVRRRRRIRRSSRRERLPGAAPAGRCARWPLPEAVGGGRASRADRGLELPRLRHLRGVVLGTRRPPTPGSARGRVDLGEEVRVVGVSRGCGGARDCGGGWCGEQLAFQRVEGFLGPRGGWFHTRTSRRGAGVAEEQLLQGA